MTSRTPFLFFALLLLAVAAPAYAQEAGEGLPAAAPGASGAAAPQMVAPPEPNYDTATVESVAAGNASADRHVTLRLTSGLHTGALVELEQHISGEAGVDVPVAAGDGVILVELADPRDPNAPSQYQITDYQRAKPVGWILAAVAGLLILVGGGRGLKTLGVLVLTGAAVAGLLVPLTLAGYRPLPLAILLSAAISLMTTLLTSGAGRKSWAAVLGTTGAVAVATLLATFSTGLARLGGVANDEGMGAIASAHGPIDFAGLLAAGMVVGALGIMLDLALSISSAVDELAEANPDLGRGLLLQAGLQVGRDLLSTASNTLLLAYMGGFLPVLLTYGAQGLSGVRLIHQEGLASEAITFAVGLAGLLVAIPLTAVVATLLQPPSRPLPEPGSTRAPLR